MRFIPEGQTEAVDIPVRDIIGYSRDTTYYALKRLYLLSDNANHLLFVKRLTREDSRIKLFI